MNIYPIKDDIKNKLLPYQISHTENIIYSLKTYSRCLDASDTGTGKTYTSIAACLSMNLKPLIICPKSVITSWKTVLNHFDASCYGVSNYESMHNCKMFTKDSKDKVLCPYLKRIDLNKKEKETSNKKNKHPDLDKDSDDEKPEKKFTNRYKEMYMKEREQRLKKYKKFMEKNNEIPIPDQDMQYTFGWKNLPDDIVIIFDEAHRCKNHKTLNSILLYTLAKTSAKIIMLSATISDTEDNFRLAGFVLGLYKNIKDAGNWMAKLSKEYTNIASGIHDELYPEYATRMRIRDLKGIFPDNQIMAKTYDMECAEEIQKQYKIIEDEIEKLQKREASSTNPLTRILYARMMIEQLKIPTFLEEAKKFLEEGNAVAIFVNFTQTLQTIAHELKTNCVIHGQQTLEDRAKAIDDFNNDKAHVIVCNMKSGSTGLSLHDLHGNFPRISIISPSWSAQDILQALGRVHRANGKTPVRQYIVFAANTIETEICKNMIEKIKNIALLNDKDMKGYEIEGMTTDLDDSNKDPDFTEFEKVFMKINALNIKKQRLEDDLKIVNDEIKSLEDLMHTFIK